MGYTVTDVTVSESDELAQLTVSITIPPRAHSVETFFSLTVNTIDGTATGVPWSLEFDYVPLLSFTNHSLAPVKLHNIMCLQSLCLHMRI